jgi:hypothetical protein
MAKIVAFRYLTSSIWEFLAHYASIRHVIFAHSKNLNYT